MCGRLYIDVNVEISNRMIRMCEIFSIRRTLSVESPRG